MSESYDDDDLTVLHVESFRRRNVFVLDDFRFTMLIAERIITDLNTSDIPVEVYRNDRKFDRGCIRDPNQRSNLNYRFSGLTKVVPWHIQKYGPAPAIDADYLKAGDVVFLECPELRFFQMLEGLWHMHLLFYEFKEAYERARLREAELLAKADKEITQRFGTSIDMIDPELAWKILERINDTAFGELEAVLSGQPFPDLLLLNIDLEY